MANFAAMQSDNPKWQEFANRLLKVYKHRNKLAQRQGISCFRIYDNDLPSFPFVVERYADKIYVAEYKRNHGMEEAEHDQWLEQCLLTIAHTLEIDVQDVYCKERKRMSHRADNQYQKLHYGDDFFLVRENGLNFLVNLSQYLDTGLFLDHRTTRKMVGEESQGKRVLNLFCYTSSFSVYAAANGAAEVTSVDLSKTYLTWSENNFRENNLSGSQYHFVHADVLQYLKALPANSYDLIVLDPPTFSNSKRMKDILDVQRDHVALINDCLHCLSPDGTLYFSTNYRKFELDTSKIKASEIKDITKSTTPFDFEGKLFRWCYRIKPI
ncbi:MAG: class I SAM-dependent methyltransferase [Chitinophagaceae bacterium]